MAIQDAQRNKRGLQTLNFSLDNTSAFPGKGDLLKHTNGNIYQIYAETYSVGVLEKRLFVSISTDEGITWGTPLALTSGYYDTEPCLLQIDETDTNSEIGICFNRAVSGLQALNSDNAITTIYRTVMNVAGALVYGIDAFPGVAEPQSLSCLNLNKSAGDYILTSLKKDTYVISVWKTPIIPANPHRGFIDNGWTATAITSATIVGESDKPVTAMSVRKLAVGDAAGHFAMLATYRTERILTADFEGYAANIRCNIGVCFSSDNMVSWSAFQPLTSYTDNPQLDLEVHLSATNPDLAEVSDGSLAVFFQEHTQHQALSRFTTPAIGVYPKHILHHPVHNLLLVGCEVLSGSGGGLYVVNLTAQTVSPQITTITSPAIRSLDISRLALSDDNKYLAIASAGGIDIYDTTSATVSDWAASSVALTTGHPTAPLLNNDIEWLEFDGNVLYFGYGTGSGVLYCWGGKVDVTDLASGVTDLKNASINNQTIAGRATPIMQATKIVLVQGAYVSAIRKSDGVGLYNTNLGASSFLGYDAINDEYLVATSSGLARVKDTGSAFTLEETFATTGTGTRVLSGAVSFMPVAGGIFISHTGSASSTQVTFYNSISKKPIFLVSTGKEQYTDHEFNYKQTPMTLVKDGAWLVGCSGDAPSSLIATPIDNQGRLRWGLFTYTPSTRTLVTSGVDFYDAANTTKIAADYYKSLKFCRVIKSSANDSLLLAGMSMNWGRTTRNNARFLSILEPDAQTIQARARIAAQATQTVSARARVRNTMTATVDSRGRLAFWQCIEARAKITNITYQTVSARAAIHNKKQTTLPVSFYVQQTGISSALRLQFYVATGYNTSMSCQARARITRASTSRTTVHFLVAANPAKTGTFTTATAPNYTKTMQARAYVIK